jgi:hypothetical protein
VRLTLFIAAWFAAFAPPASASAPPLLPSSQVAAIANELSGEAELSAEYGPVAVDLILEYLEALKRIGVVE